MDREVFNGSLQDRCSGSAIFTPKRARRRRKWRTPQLPYGVSDVNCGLAGKENVSTSSVLLAPSDFASSMSV